MKARKRMEELVDHPYIRADVGMFFDGDGDRLGVVDEKVIWGLRNNCKKRFSAKIGDEVGSFFIKKSPSKVKIV